MENMKNNLQIAINENSISETRINVRKKNWMRLKGKFR